MQGKGRHVVVVQLKVVRKWCGIFAVLEETPDTPA